MRLVIDPHAQKRSDERSIDLTMLMAEGLQAELKALLHGGKLIKQDRSNTIVFKKSNTSDTVFIKTAWCKHKPKKQSNNSNYKNPITTA